MAYVNSQGQVRIFVRDGSKIGLGVPYVYVPPTIFDTYTTTPQLGYSLRKLRTGYSGNAIRVRRSYDNAETDIGFASNGVLDTTALKTFVDAGKTLGDQDIANWDSISYATQSIVTDSIIFNLNSGSNTSYPGSGNTVSSLVGSNDGTLQNVSFELSNGGTLGFNGSSSQITYSSTILSQTTEFTLSTWVYISGIPSSNRQILSWQSTNSNSLYLGLSTGSTSSNATLNFGSTFSVVLENQFIDRWIEITAVKTSTDAFIYVNGSLLTQKRSPLTFTTPNNLVLGSNVNASEYFSGRLAQVKIYNKSLSSSEVYQNYRATCGTFNQDHDALSFINTAGLTNSTHINAVHRLVRDLKNNKLWTKLRVAYPFVGGTQLSHSINLKDPRDLDAARRIRFYGGWTHSSTGAQPNGTNGWANTYYNASTDGINTSEMHLAYYSRTNTDNTGIEIGVQGSTSTLWYLQLKNANFTYFGENNSYNRGYNNWKVASTSGDGNFLIQNSLQWGGKYSFLYKNGSLSGYVGMANNAGFDAAINKEVYIGALNNGTTASNFSNKEVSFATIGDSMVEVEIFKLNLIIQKFQTSLGRQIGSSYSTINHVDSDLDIFFNNAQITNTLQQSAVENLVKSLKYEGIWHTGLATYPMVGGTASSHRFNLNNYNFSLSFGGGWTHTSTGALPNGTNAYADPGILATKYFSANTGHFGFYTRSNTNVGFGMGGGETVDILASSDMIFTMNSLGVSARVNSRLVGCINGQTYAYSSIDVKESTGFSFTMRGEIAGSASTRIYLMKNDNLDYVDSSMEGIGPATIPNTYIGLASVYQDGYGWRFNSSREHSYSTIGTKDMTQIQAKKYGRIVQRYQQQLGREATITDLPYSTGEGFVKTWYDQSITGSNLNMNTVVSQPMIYTNGSVITDNNGKAAIQFDGWNDAMFTQKNINFTNTGSIIAVYSGTSSGIYTGSNNSTFQSTTIGTYLPSAYSWTSNGRNNNGRMPLRAFGDNNYIINATSQPYWAWSVNSTGGGQFGGYSTTGATLLRGDGVNISSFYLIGSTMQLSNNFTVDTASGGYLNNQQPNPGSLIIGAYTWQGGQQHSKMKYQEILVFDKSYSITNKLSQEKNIYDFYTPFTANTVSDPDANNLAVYNRLSVTQSAALNTLTIGLKSTVSGTVSLWDKMVAIYPIIGGNAQAHAYNLKNVSYDGNAWTMFHSGGITHDSTGMAYNGTNGTSIIYKALSDNFSPNNFHMSFYLNGGTVANGGPYTGDNGLIMQNGSNTVTHLSANTTTKSYNNVSVSNTTTNGYFIATSTTQDRLFRNGTLLGTASVSTVLSNGYKGTNFYGSGGTPRITIGSNFNIGAYRNIKSGFITIGYGLTDTDVTNLNNLVLTYQAALGR